MLDSKKDQLVTFTEVATKKLQEVMKEQGSENSYLRVSINETPNGGFEYVFGLVDEPEKDDIIGGSAIKTVVDPASVKFVEGSNIDYVEGFQRSGFVISNPNFKSGGGCGGGAAGAFPPVIGWTIATGSLSIEPLTFFLNIFFWTP